MMHALAYTMYVSVSIRRMGHATTHHLNVRATATVKRPVVTLPTADAHGVKTVDSHITLKRTIDSNPTHHVGNSVKVIVGLVVTVDSRMIKQINKFNARSCLSTGLRTQQLTLSRKLTYKQCLATRQQELILLNSRTWQKEQHQAISRPITSSRLLIMEQDSSNNSRYPPLLLTND